ncbi:MAG: type II toxin-antitoxin system RelE/ParE family toxin [Planctomycetaceae bacterium]|nr:type II toxin-antitoxin system RelE/ParE family toxin [Planctomycetaceae bacterium]
MPKVHYSVLAARDLAENAEYIARDRPDAAYQWIDAIESTCVMLAANPELGELRESPRLGHCRSFTSGKYVIFLTVTDFGEGKCS